MVQRQQLFLTMLFLIMLAITLVACSESSALLDNGARPTGFPQPDEAGRPDIPRTATPSDRSENWSMNRTNGGRAMNDQMMQQAIASCEGKAENDDCVVQTPSGDITGSCDLHNYTLACRPRGAPQSNGAGP